MRENKLNNKVTIILCYSILFVILELFHSFVGMYFDDYGNASLSYGYDAGVAGMNWTMQDLGSWAKWIYLNFSGRIMCGSLLNVLFKLGHGPHLFMAVQAGIMVLLFYVMYRITMYVTKQKYNVLMVIIPVALFFIMPSDMYRWNLCWASASVLYIWPLLPFFTAIYLQLQLDEEKEIAKKKRAGYGIVCVICILFSAFSHEQTGLSIAVYLVVYAIYEKIAKKRVSLQNIVLAVIGLVTYAALFLAPGNWNRLDGNTDFAQLSFWQKIQTNFKPIMDCLFSTSFCVLYLVITVTLVCFSYKKWKEEQKKSLLVIAVASLIMLLLVMIPVVKAITVVALLLETMYLLAIFASLLCYQYEKQRDYLSILLLASAASAFCVLISPTLPLRCFTEWVLVIHIIFMVQCYDFWCVYAANSKKVMQAGYVAACVGVCGLGIYQFQSLAFGYLSNKDAHQKNEAILSNYKETQSELYLNKLPIDFYSPAMPYSQGFEYIEYWMKEYYDIPQNVAFVWTRNSVVNEKTNGDFYEDGWFGKNGTITIKKCYADQLHLKCYLPEEDTEEQDVTVAVNGKEETYHLVKGQNDIEVPLKYNKKNTIKITAQGAKLRSSGDERELAFLISYYFE